MKTSKYTPGPWTVYSEQRDQTITTEQGKEIATVTCRPGAVYKANARLIAAAPELLAALIELHAASGRSRVFHMDLPERNRLIDAHDAATAAIVKANGGKP